MAVKQVQLDNLYVGDTQQVSVAIVDSNSAAIDITGYTLEYTVKTDFENEVELYTDSATVFTDATNGLHTFLVPSATTANWTVRSNVYDVVTQDTVSTRTTYQIGAFTVSLPVHNTP